MGDWVLRRVFDMEVVQVESREMSLLVVILSYVLRIHSVFAQLSSVFVCVCVIRCRPRIMHTDLEDDGIPIPHPVLLANIRIIQITRKKVEPRQLMRPTHTKPAAPSFILFGGRN